MEWKPNKKDKCYKVRLIIISGVDNEAKRAAGLYYYTVIRMHCTQFVVTIISLRNHVVSQLIEILSLPHAGYIAEEALLLVMTPSKIGNHNTKHNLQEFHSSLQLGQ